MTCLECARGFHWECGEPCCCAGLQDNVSLSEEIDLVPRTVGRPRKPDDEISISAGRKRAAKEYDEEMGLDKLCEWLGLSNCGGGFKPIIGCLRGRRTDRHHGPDKNTSNNESHNISLICSLCHNRWHAANDPLYKDNKCPEGIEPKRPRPQTKEEFIQAIAFEANRKE